jgi:apolipoprotein N-acyltransferase
VTAVIAPDGSLAAALAAGTTGVLRAVVPDAASTPTPYVRTGDLFARACVGACALAAAAAAASRRRSAPGASRAARR